MKINIKYKEEQKMDELRFRIASQVNRCFKESSECILCHDKPAFIGVFITENDTGEEFGAPKGKARLMPYPVCKNHATEQYTAEVELKLKQLYKNIK
jgi:hypothetical protein